LIVLNFDTVAQRYYFFSDYPPQGRPKNDLFRMLPNFFIFAA